MGRNPTDELARKTLQILKIKCTMGVYAKNLFSKVSNDSLGAYSLDDISWMVDFARNENEHIAADCIRCLCKKGKSLEEFSDVLCDRVNDKIFSSKMIDLAMETNCPDALSAYMEEDSGYVNKVLVALKKTHNESYMTMFSFSHNDALAKSTLKIVKSKQQ